MKVVYTTTALLNNSRSISFQNADISWKKIETGINEWNINNGKVSILDEWPHKRSKIMKDYTGMHGRPHQRWP